MTLNKRLIEARVIDTLAAHEPLNPINTLFRGFAYAVPQSRYPYLEVAITDWTLQRVTTGNRHEKEYTGQVRLWQRQVDIPAATGPRIEEVASYDFIQGMVDEIVNLLSLPENRNLGGLVFTDPPGAVNVFTVTGGAYGAADRVNTLDNGGIVTFTCHTWETIV